MTILLIFCLLLGACSRNLQSQGKVDEAVELWNSHIYDGPNDFDETFRTLSKKEVEMWIKELYKVNTAAPFEEIDANPYLSDDIRIEKKDDVGAFFEEMWMTNALSVKLFGESMNRLTEEEGILVGQEYEKLKREGKLEAELGKPPF